MDDDFFKSIDERLSNIGRDETWKRKIAGRDIWFAPISRNNQSIIDEILNKGDLGIQYLNEAKKHNLSYAIVGVDDIDLRQIKEFYVTDLKEKKKLQVSREKYLYHKIGDWGTQFVDDVFKVFADLMTAHEKKNLKDVSFENTKDPLEELSELESRVAELREQLKLPPLVVKNQTEETKALEQAVSESDSEPGSDFNPFKTVKQPEVGTEPIQKPFVNMENVEIDASLRNQQLTPVDVKQRVQKRSTEYAQIENLDQEQVIEKKPIPVANPNILDKHLERKEVEPPVLDPRPSHQSRNPRFSPPR
jgi:hypothetical protein